MSSALAPLRGRLPRHWEAWTGVGGLLYARRRMVSPPIVVRAYDADELIQKARLKVPGDFPKVSKKSE